MAVLENKGEEPVVLSVAFPFAVVGSGAVGGAEVVLSAIESALPSLGFRSVVVAREGSTPTGQLYATPAPAGEIHDAARALAEAAHQANIDRACMEHPVSVVHMHGLDFHRYRLPVDLPVIVTLHLPPRWYPERIWNLPSNYHFFCVSETQKQSCPTGAREWVQVIGNGVALPDPASLRPGGRYALMLSRICPEKNLHTGFEAAQLAGLPVILGGEVFPYRDHLRYFAEQIEPRLTSANRAHTERGRDPDCATEARFLGPVTGAAKARLLSRAACLLLPSLAPETSSLVAMEALAAGVPVVAVASGAVPEIVEHGRTGFLVPASGDISANLASALRQVQTLDRGLCRQAAETRFSLTAMLGSYATLYRRLARARPAQKPREPDRHTFPNGQAPDLAIHQPDPARTRLVVGSGGLDALRAAWAELWDADPTSTPFQHPAWLLPWAEQFGPDGVVQAVTQWDGRGRLLGLLPLFVYCEPSTQMRKLLLLGAGTTDYLGGVFRPPSAPSLAAEALRFAMTAVPAWSRLDLLQLRSDSPLLHATTSLAGLETSAGEPCAILATAGALAAKVGANVRRYTRRAQAQGQLRCTLPADLAEARAWFEELVRLHGQRWEARDQMGVLNDPRVLRHHREALPALLAAGLLRIFRLRCGEDTVAVLYALADPPGRPVRRLYLYLIGIDVRHADISPGTLILNAVWEYARQEGFAELDLLRGGERYKTFWGAAPAATHAVHTSRCCAP